MRDGDFKVTFSANVTHLDALRHVVIFEAQYCPPYSWLWCGELPLTPTVV
jgi:hypothetical protein